jgi:hypothetical protein
LLFLYYYSLLSLPYVIDVMHMQYDYEYMGGGGGSV